MNHDERVRRGMRRTSKARRLLLALVSAVGLALLLLTTGAARGQESPPPSALDGAIDHYWDGMFDQAVSEIEGMLDGLEGTDRRTAYEYLARSYIRLDDEANGKAAYKELLRLAPEWRPDASLVAGPEMTVFETALTEYENENLGAVSVRTEPTRANVYLDGELQKEPTPVTLERVPAGDHAIHVELEGWSSVDTTIAVLPADIATLDLVLTEQPVETASSFWKSPWFLGAGGALGLGLIFALGGGGGGGGGDDTVTGDLPGFPDPPK